MYKFSLPLPFNSELIDDFIEINKKVNNSKITVFYNSLYCDSPDYCGFEQARVDSHPSQNKIQTLDDLARELDYVYSKGFEFVYLANSMIPFIAYKDSEIEQSFKKLDKIIRMLEKFGTPKLRVSNVQLMSYLNQEYPNVEIYGSTSVDYTSIKQYDNLFKAYKNIVEIIPSFDVNKDFMFLKNFKKKFPNIRVELMINEGCIAGCPFRVQHCMNNGTKVVFQDKAIAKKYCRAITRNCATISQKNFWEYVCKSNILYPWELKEYGKIGINNFKLVGRNSALFNKKSYSKIVEWYLMGVDDEKSIDNAPFNLFSSYLWIKNMDITIKDIKPFLPKLSYFKKYGNLCSERCSVECNYCYKCAKKIEQKFGNIFFEEPKS